MSKNIHSLQTILKNLPQSPGIYQFFDANEKIIYIGKSVHLKNRVSSYFDGIAKLNFAKKKMVGQITHIEYIVTNNETESLILEHTLVKKHQPKYNILLKDDKNYLYIKITREAIPRIITTRIKSGPGEYFGPYISSNYVKNVLKIVKKLFGYRSCNIDFAFSPLLQKRDGAKILAISNTFLLKKNGNISSPLLRGDGEGFLVNTKQDETRLIIKSLNGWKVPCMDYYIKRCAGPCLLTKETLENYKKSIEKIEHFLSGNYTEVLKSLEIEMRKKASELRFEEARKIKESIEALQSLENTQIVRDFIDGNFDVINYIEKYNRFFIGVIEIRESKITGYKNYEVENKLEETQDEIMTQFVEDIIAGSQGNKEKISFLLASEIHSEYLDSYKKYIEVPKIGSKLDILKLCYKNIYEYAYKKHLASLSTKGFTKQTQKNLLSTLGYEVKNKDIVFECNDISHLSGSHTVASRSIIENGKANPSKYRKFTIKTLEEGKIDDFASMREIITRRLKELIEKRNLPDLIIIDGGKGQLGAVMQVIEEVKSLNENISLSMKKGIPRHDEEKSLWSEKGDGEGLFKILSSLQICSLAKQEEEIFLPYQSESIKLKKDTEELRLIQKIRDEAHRFAITFNRDKRSSALKKNILESIPGIGPKTRTALLKEFGSVTGLKDISKDILKKYLKQNQMEALENHGII